MSTRRSQPGTAALAAITDLRRMPPRSLFGMVVIGLGLGAVVLAHVEPALEHAHGAVTAEQLSAHLVTFVGMVMVLTGVFVDGIRSSVRSTTKEMGHAVR